MFLRRLYYNDAGEILHSYMMQGSLRPLTAGAEAARLGLENWAVMEWTTPAAEIEQNFIDSYGRVSVDLSGEEPVLCFDFSPFPVEESPEEDMLAALTLLGYEEG